MHWLIKLITGHPLEDVASALGMYNRQYKRRIVFTYIAFIAAIACAEFGIYFAGWLWDVVLSSPNGTLFYELLSPQMSSPVFLPHGVVIDDISREFYFLGRLIVFSIWIPLLFLPPIVPFPPPLPDGLLVLSKKIHLAIMTILPSIIMIIILAFTSDFRYIITGPIVFTHGVTEWVGEISYILSVLTGLAVPGIMLLPLITSYRRIDLRAAILLGSLSLSKVLTWLFSNFTHVDFITIDQHNYILSLMIGISLVFIITIILVLFRSIRMRLVLTILASFTIIKLFVIPVLYMVGPYPVLSFGMLSILWGDNCTGSLINIGAMM